MKQTGKMAYAADVCEAIQDLDVEALIFIDDPDSSNLCRAIDLNHRYGAYSSAEHALVLSICSYYDEAKPEFYGSNYALAVIEGHSLEEYLPENMLENYVYVKSVRWYDLYVSQGELFSW